MFIFNTFGFGSPAFGFFRLQSPASRSDHFSFAASLLAVDATVRSVRAKKRTKNKFKILLFLASKRLNLRFKI